MTTESTRINSQTQVPSLTLTRDPTVSSVDATARERLSPPLSPTSAQLRSNEQGKEQQLQQKYKQACELTDPEQARTLFFELINGTPKCEHPLLFLADCKIKCANTYPEDSQERTDAATIAKATLDQAYESRGTWDSLSEEEKIHQYKYLRSCLKEFEKLVQNDVSSLENSVEAQIEECSRHIPLLSDYCDKLNEGDRLQENEAKREVYHQALRMIKDQEGPGYHLARAYGFKSLALTYTLDDTNPCSAKALEQATIAYKQKEALFTDDQKKLRTLESFSKLFHNLIQLFSDGSEQLVAINTMLDECCQELARCQGAVPKDGSKVSPRVSPKVSKEPVDPWKTARIVFAFGFAVIVITGAFVLGRRYITNLSK